MKEVVKYHNELNTVLMRKWTKEEMNFFFTILAKTKEKGIEALVFSTDELKELTHFSKEHNQRWEDTMRNAADKIGQLTYREETDREFVVMPLFQYFRVSYATRTVTVQVSTQFEYILNRLQARFTVYELEEFVNIRSTYAKTMYRLLKQWRTQGKKEFSKEDLFILLDVPKSTQTATNFNKRVLAPIKEELTSLFNGLAITPIKTKGRGNPVVAYEFTWKPETVKKKTKEIDKPQETPRTADNREAVPFYNWLET